MTFESQRSVLLLTVEDASRADILAAQLSLLLPRASLVTGLLTPIGGPGKLPEIDAAIIDGSAEAKRTVEGLLWLRAHGIEAPILIVTPTPDDAALRATAHAMGARVAARERIDESPAELAAALTAALDSKSNVTAELRRARRIFAAGQSALSLQHGINNPLAALLAEAQLLQLEELTAEQRGAVERMVELCRRIVALVRQLDALAES